MYSHQLSNNPVDTSERHKYLEPISWNTSKFRFLITTLILQPLPMANQLMEWTWWEFIPLELCPHLRCSICDFKYNYVYLFTIFFHLMHTIKELLKMLVAKYLSTRLKYACVSDWVIVLRYKIQKTTDLLHCPILLCSLHYTLVRHLLQK